MTTKKPSWSVDCCTQPVFGCRIDPRIYLQFFNRQAPQYKLECQWHRERKGSSSSGPAIQCCVHPDKIASQQCDLCIKLNLPLKGSYYCSRKCMRTAKHIKLHKYAELHLLTNPEVGDIQCRREDQDDKRWELVSGVSCYEPKREDLQFRLRLKCRAMNVSTGARLCEDYTIVTDRVVYPTSYLPRGMIECLRPPWSSLMELSDLKVSTVEFTILSYRFLGDLDVMKYPQCPGWVISTEYRQQNLLNEIIDYDADIICLQGVNSNQFQNFFAPQFSKCGYSFIYQRKKGSADCAGNECMDGCAGNECMDGCAGNKCMDGCATFFRNDLLQLINNFELELGMSSGRRRHQLHGLEFTIRGSHLCMKKENISLVAILQTKSKEGSCTSTPRRFFVANTQLDPNPPEFYYQHNLFEVEDLLLKLKRISEENNSTGELPLVLCGDFDIDPRSTPYRFIIDGEVASRQRSSEIADHIEELPFRHAFNLTSAYSYFYRSDVNDKFRQHKCMEPETHEPLFTKWISNTEFSGTRDYMFFTEGSLTLDGVLQLPDAEELGNGLPCERFSSDHVALMASFKIPSSTDRKRDLNTKWIKLCGLFVVVLAVVAYFLFTLAFPNGRTGLALS